MTKFGWYMIFLAYKWYFELILIFRVPVYGLFWKFKSIWQPWKWNLTSQYWSGSLKTHRFEFCFSGFPKFGYQGCHISERALWKILKFPSISSTGSISQYPTVGFDSDWSLTGDTLWRHVIDLVSSNKVRDFASLK